MRILFLGAVAALVLGAGPAAAAPDAIVGNWSGGGVARPADGTPPERVQCRLSYAEGTGRTFELTANCAHAHGTFQQTGRVVSRGNNRYTGRIYSDQYGATGEVVVSVNGNRQSLSVTSPRGSARATLTRRQ